MRRLQIDHTTTYQYSAIVELLPHKLLLRPREGHDIRIESSRLEITPTATVKWQRDVYGNSVAIATFKEPMQILRIFSEVVIQHFEETPLDFLVAPYAVNFPFHYNPIERVDLIPYQVSLYPEDTQVVADWLFQFWQPGQLVETYVLLDRLNKAIAQNFTYLKREEPGVQTPAYTLQTLSGSCRDFATLFIEACRYVGLAARFVSGYLHAPIAELGGGATHAWSEVYLPGAGWKGFDSTSGHIVGNDHIAVAVNRHQRAIPPISGNFIGPTKPQPDLTVGVKVTDVS
jgi:transglutaminase-like putative cysteine protease